MSGIEGQSSVKADRRRLQIRLNEYVKCNDHTYKVSQIIDFEKITGLDIKTGKTQVLLIKDISAIDQDTFDNGFVHGDSAEISDANWLKIEKRFEIIKPLLNNPGRKAIESRANEFELAHTTVYRWLARYKTSGVMTSLLPRKPGAATGQSRITKEQESIVSEIIEEHYLTPQRLSAQEIIHLVAIACKKANIKPPSKNTIRSRISQISTKDQLTKRGEKSLARTRYNPAPGTFPNADHPLSVVQIDHTPMDIILVDDENRLPIGRPWITVAIDIYSRMITGYYLSLDPPSTTSVAMCIAHSVLPKEMWLQEHNVDATWPVWGFMNTIHVDNGADFRGETLRESCLPYNINLEFRPVNKTNYGGHIERLLGTVLKKVHSLPGTTFSNIKERSTYDSDKNACMSFSAFEQWLLIYITQIYHKKIHSGLDIPPQLRWNDGIFGDLHNDGVGFLPKPTDPETVLIDFLPIARRTIQKNGVNIGGLNYYDHVLRQSIKEVDPTTKKIKTFIFRRDIRDITYVWFFESNSQVYYKIPLADQSVKPMSLWEFNTTKKLLKERGEAFQSMHQLTDSQELMNNLAKAEEKQSKAARRKLQKTKVHQNSKKIIQTNSLSEETVVKDEIDDLWDDDVEAY